jgi:hypothetical protein
MLDNVSKRTRDCLLKAEECSHQAPAQNDPKIRQDYLYAEQRWLTLAKSIEFTERLGRFTRNAPVIFGLICPKCDRVASACASRGPPFTITWLPPSFSVVKKSPTRQGTKIGCRCGEIFEL